MLHQSLRNAAKLHVDVICPQHTIAQRDIVLGIDRTRCAGESALVFGQAFQANRFAMDPRPSLAPTLSLRTRQVSHGIALGPRAQVMALIQQWRDDTVQF